jgi:hypothetical protein
MIAAIAETYTHHEETMFGVADNVSLIGALILGLAFAVYLFSQRKRKP